ncbi:Do family serine endopeptidase [Salinispirillum sp. LH 10-3-1]|uniref:Probable periplasmic serine endoprotease DegP-like n=1 Tax=Salinispirillum sp. LH 10-3-1 TaxID=2952525 RepID=A0AB38YEZ0_9GAMM
MRNKATPWLSILVLSAMLVFAQSAGAQTVTLPDFVTLAEEYSPSVVRIEAEGEPNRRQQQQMEQWQQQMPEMFRYFFGDQMPNQPQQQQPRRSQGSGFIISSDGYVVTNHHVIAGANSVRVRLDDQRSFAAEVVGTDEQSDLALLKVDATNLPSLSFGDSDQLRVGEWVLAIGAPFGMDYSVTAGIVSAKGRSLGDRYVPFIQTDVAINPGNSGGPLFNTQGQVIGINSQIYTRSGGFMGLSFAIPSNMAMDIIEQLRDTGVVARGWLGIAMDSNYNDDQMLAESFGLDRPVGALVQHVYNGTPAEDAGLIPGDLILSFGSREIRRYTDLAPLVGATRPGTMVNLEIVRNGERMTLPLRIGAFPEDEQQVVARAAPTPDVDNPLKVRVRDLTQGEARAAQERGVIIDEVFEGPAMEADLRQGDIITMMHGQFVRTKAEFDAVAEDLPEGRRVALRIIRDGAVRFVSVAL